MNTQFHPEIVSAPENTWVRIKYSGQGFFVGWPHSPKYIPEGMLARGQMYDFRWRESGALALEFRSANEHLDDPNGR